MCNHRCNIKFIYSCLDIKQHDSKQSFVVLAILLTFHKSQTNGNVIKNNSIIHGGEKHQFITEENDKRHLKRHSKLFDNIFKTYMEMNKKIYFFKNNTNTSGGQLLRDKVKKYNEHADNSIDAESHNNKYNKSNRESALRRPDSGNSKQENDAVQQVEEIPNQEEGNIAEKEQDQGDGEEKDADKQEDTQAPPKESGETTTLEPSFESLSSEETTTTTTTRATTRFPQVHDDDEDEDVDRYVDRSDEAWYLSFRDRHNLPEPYQLPGNKRVVELENIQFCRCPRVYWPTCGTDGITYMNVCILQCLSKTLRRYGPCIVYR